MKQKSDDARWFDALAALAVTVQYQFDELTHNAYRASLADVPITYVEKACFELSREPLKWFPKAGDIRERAEQIARRSEPVKALPAGAVSTGYACVTCRDTGWKYVGHNAVQPCECRPTNPNYQATHPSTGFDWSQV